MFPHRDLDHVPVEHVLCLQGFPDGRAPCKKLKKTQQLLKTQHIFLFSFLYDIDQVKIMNMNMNYEMNKVILLFTV